MMHNILGYDPCVSVVIKSSQSLNEIRKLMHSK